MNALTIRMTINGQDYAGPVDVSMTLLEYLREDCGLTGVKCGCENGECGACTVLVNGRPVRSCLILAVEADGASVITVEGLASVDTAAAASASAAAVSLHPVQQSLVQTGAVQCGFCIPGVTLAATALLERHPTPDKEQVLEALGGHLCRCAGYEAISDAVFIAADTLSGLSRS
jgi:carbon-monoxide dehydrogenase small subunit